MKISKLLIMMILSSTVFLQATGFLKEASAKPILVQEGSKKQWCAICGMNLKMFYKTSHAATFTDGTKRQYCSIRCLVMDMNNNNIDIASIQVVDAKTEKLIDAKSAFYLVGSKIKGTMTQVSKLAFYSQLDAVEFQKKYQGKIVDFSEALKIAQKSLNTDIMMVTKKKEKKIYPMGERIFTKVCEQNIKISKFKDINELKAYIQEKKVCKKLKEKQLQAVVLYLWEVKRINNDTSEMNIQVGKDEKCPVCGMYVYKYPKWVAQIYFTHDDHEHHFSFDGVKDMMKFYLEPKKWGNYELYETNKISKILVTDYYSQKTISAKDAFFVTNSDIYGPMGAELIPFANENDANIFKKDHFGKKILKFDEINIKEIGNLGTN